MPENELLNLRRLRLLTQQELAAAVGTSYQAATMMFARGPNVVKVCRILGHASVKVTSDTYIHR